MRARLSLLVLPLALAACQPQSDLPTTSDVDATRGAALFAQDCSVCHGEAGEGGRGPNLTRLSARNGGTFPQTGVMATIDGLARHGQAGAVMPEFGADDLGDTVVLEDGTPVPADLLALSAYLKTIQE